MRNYIEGCGEGALIRIAQKSSVAAGRTLHILNHLSPLINHISAVQSIRTLSGQVTSLVALLSRMFWSVLVVELVSSILVPDCVLPLDSKAPSSCVCPWLEFLKFLATSPSWPQV